MKKFIAPFATVCFVALTFASCTKDVKSPTQDEISDETIAQVKAWGFGTSSLQKHEDGYLVEGDIILTPEQLAAAPVGNVYRVGEEQYHTTNMVKALPRTVTISMDSKFPSSYITALDEAIRRYNAENLSLTFQRGGTSGGNIHIVTAGGNYLASAGFPTSGGDPYNQIKVNTRAIGNQPMNTVATILAHEIGHCIGFRHTDYYNRQISCGGSPSNEGASTVGAIHIPGTPTTADGASFMLACIGSGQNRPFSSYDRTALNYLFP